VSDPRGVVVGEERPVHLVVAEITPNRVGGGLRPCDQRSAAFGEHMAHHVRLHELVVAHKAHFQLLRNAEVLQSVLHEVRVVLAPCTGYRPRALQNGRTGPPPTRDRTPRSAS